MTTLGLLPLWNRKEEEWSRTFLYLSGNDRSRGNHWPRRGLFWSEVFPGDCNEAVQGVLDLGRRRRSFNTDAINHHILTTIIINVFIITIATSFAYTNIIINIIWRTSRNVRWGSPNPLGTPTTILVRLTVPVWASTFCVPVSKEPGN